MPNIVIRFNGNDSAVRLDREGRWNMADLHAASGLSRSTRPPSNWLRNQQAIDLIEELNQSADLQSEIIHRQTGGATPGIWVDERLALAYTEYLSAQFHRSVLETFQAATRGEGEAAVEVAQKVILREDGKVTRKKFTSYLSRRGARKNEYSEMSDLINQAVLGKKSKAMKADLGLRPSASLRDALNEEQLLDLSICEGLAARRLSRGFGRNTRNLREDVSAGVIDFLRVIQ